MPDSPPHVNGNGAGSIAGSPLVLVSNRGPVTFDRDEDGERIERRGTGGLVTALTGLVNHRSDTLWVASAMTAEDVAVSDERGGRSFTVRTNADIEYLSLIHISEPTRRTPISYA